MPWKKTCALLNATQLQVNSLFGRSSSRARLMSIASPPYNFFRRQTSFESRSPSGASSEPRPPDGERRSGVSGICNIRRGRFSGRHALECQLNPLLNGGLLGRPPGGSDVRLDNVIRAFCDEGPRRAPPHCPLSRSVLFNSHRQLQQTGDASRRCRDPDNVVHGSLQSLSLVDGFSLMSGPGGANHQRRRAINIKFRPV
jgi:hypothetical protein